MKKINDTGWISIHRQLIESELWLSERFTKAQAWIDLIGLANHTDNDVLVDYKKVTVKRGQMITSQVKLAKRWGWNRRTVNKFLSYIKNEGMIHMEVHRQNNKGFTVISIQNYDKYQPRTQANTQGSAQGSSRAVHINNNDNNDNNNNIGVESTKVVEEIRDFWNGEYGTKYTSVIGFQENALFWLTQYSLDDIKLAIKNIRRSEYWRNEMTPLIFFRRKSPSKEPVDYIAQFMNIKASPVKKEQPQGIFAQIVQHERGRGLL